MCKDGLLDRTVWLVLKRTLGAKPSYVAYISNAPVSTPLSRFVWLSGLRWAIEQCFEESKTELGMDHLYTLAEVLALIAWVQRRNHSAYLSHRKRREAEG